MRFTVQRKIIFLGTGLSLLLVISSFLISFFVFETKTKDAYKKAIDYSIDEVSYSVGDASTSESIIKFYNAIYDAYSNYTEEIPESFADDQEEYEFYKNLYSNIYPGTGFGMSKDKLEYQSIYIDISAILTSVSISSGGLGAYAGFYVLPKGDSDEIKFVYLFDSVYKFNGSTYTGVGNLPGKQIIIKPGDYDSNPLTSVYKAMSGGTTESRSEYVIKGTTTKTVDYDLGTKDDGSHIVLSVFVKYDINEVNDEIRFFLLVDGLSLLAVVILLIIAYILIARFVIVKNVLKLTDSTNEFTDNIKKGEVNTSIDPKIKSKDEIGVLSNSFIKMEDEIIDYTKKIEQATAERERMNAELEVATKIQLEALPKNNLNDQNVLIQTSIESAKEVGGDFYDYFYIDKSNLAIIVSDVSGKGIPAALFMMKSKELIKSKLLANKDLSQVAYEVNNELLSNNELGLFITAFIGIINVDRYELKIVNAGHEKPYLIRGNEVEKLEINSNFILGGVSDFQYELDTIKLEKGDKLFIHTDGLNESINEAREEFGYDRIIENLKLSSKLTLNETLTNMTKALEAFSTSEQFDDVTMLILEIKDSNLHFKFEKPDYSIITEVTAKFNDYYSYLDKEITAKVAIIFDEILNNYVSYETRDDLIIEININDNKKSLIIDFYNNGIEFNPLLKEDKYITGDEDVIPGGFGITMVKELSDDISYERKDEINHLRIIKKI